MNAKNITNNAAEPDQDYGQDPGLENTECNYCGSDVELKTVPWAPGFFFCRECRERFEIQDKMIKSDLEIQPEIE